MRKRTAGKMVAVTGVTAAMVLSGVTSASAAPSVLTGAGRAAGNVRIAVAVYHGAALTGAFTYYDGRAWLNSTHPVALTVNGRVAKLKGTATWNGQSVVYYLQVRDRSPKRADTFSLKVKQGKQVVLRQTGPLTSGDLVVA